MEPFSLAKNTSETSERVQDRELPNYPFSSPLAREALLDYAYRLYDNSSAPPPTGLTRGPLDAPSTSKGVHDSQLLPLVTMLRMLHVNTVTKSHIFLHFNDITYPAYTFTNIVDPGLHTLFHGGFPEQFGS